MAASPRLLFTPPQGKRDVQAQPCHGGMLTAVSPAGFTLSRRLTLFTSTEMHPDWRRAAGTQPLRISTLRNQSRTISLWQRASFSVVHFANAQPQR